MTIITPTPIASLPAPPVKGRAGFNAAAELYLSALANPFTPQVNAAIAATNANALSAEQSAITAQAAASGVSVDLWVDSKNYAAGDSVKSPAALSAGAQNPIYICKVATAGTHIDPYNDPAHWSIFTISSGVGGAVYATSTTLTASSPFAISISGGPGVWLKLPDATTLPTGIRHAVRNTGDNDLTLIDAAGAHIGFIRPQCGTTIALSDNSMVAGKWAGDWESVGITADLQFGAAIAGLQNVKQIIQLDATRTMILTGGSSGQGLYAVVYDTATQSAGAAVLVRAAINGAMAIKSATDQVLVASFDSGNIYASVLTISVKEITGVTSSNTTIAGAFSSTGHFVAVGGAFACSYFTTSGIVRAITISGTTPSIGVEQSAAASGAPRLYVNGSMLRVVRVSNASTVICTPYSISGNTMTTGTAASTGTAINDTAVRTFTTTYGGDIWCFHAYSGYYVASIFKLSSTTESVLSINVFSYNSTNLNANYLTTNSHDYSVISINKVLFFGFTDLWTSNTNVSVNLVTNTSGTPSVGTSISYSGASATACNVTDIKCKNANEALIQIYSTSNFQIVGIDCSGSSPAKKYAYQLTSRISGIQAASKYNNGVLNAAVCANSVNTFIIGYFNSNYYVTPIYAMGASGASIPIKIPLIIRAGNYYRGENDQATWIATAATSSPDGSLGIALQRIQIAQV